MTNWDEMARNSIPTDCYVVSPFFKEPKKALYYGSSEHDGYIFGRKMIYNLIEFPENDGPGWYNDEYYRVIFDFWAK